MKLNRTQPFALCLILVLCGGATSARNLPGKQTGPTVPQQEQMAAAAATSGVEARQTDEPARMNGLWKWTTPEGEFGLELSQHDEDVLGILQVDGRTVSLQDIDLQGDRLHFETQVAQGSRLVPIRFEARLQGQTLTGDMAIADNVHAVTATRAE